MGRSVLVSVDFRQPYLTKPLKLGYFQPHGMQYAHPKLTTAQAATSLKPMIDFIATLGSLVTGTNGIVEVPSFYKFESQIVAPTIEV